MGAFLSVRALHEEGLAKKAIARRLGLDVRTVRKYVRRIEAGATAPKRAKVASKLDGFDPVIEVKVGQGLSAVQIFQDLEGEPDFDASYESVKLRVRALRRVEPRVYCRMRYAPAEEAPIDFGAVGKVAVDGKQRAVHLFVMTLCYSRMAYDELVLDQRVATFLGANRRAFEYFGGVPGRLKPDNLKSAVLVDRLNQRYYQEDFFRFCRHYGMLPDATRIATPTDKGRTERDIGYAKGSCFRSRSFQSLEEARAHLLGWREEVANVRIHGTTRRRPVDLFEEERPHLGALPAEPYEIAEWGLYKVRKDCHIHVLGNYYSVPHRWVGTKVLVRLTEETLTVFAEGDEVACHGRLRGQGQDATDPAHYPETKRISSQEIHQRRLLAMREAGPQSARFLH
jgi:transposase